MTVNAARRSPAAPAHVEGPAAEPTASRRAAAPALASAVPAPALTRIPAPAHFASAPRRAAASARIAAALAALALIAALLGGCAASSSHPEAKTRQTVTVFAAASLREAFTQIARDNPDLDVRFSFLGSNTLLDQMRQGAPADVFASADQATMQKARAAGLVQAPRVFTSNTLRLIVPRGNPGGITGLDGSLAGKRLVVCARRVPCGEASASLARLVGVELHPVSQETKVTDVRGKVASGQADAGLVYATDALTVAAKVQVVPVPQAARVVNTYPVALTRDAPHPRAARRFVRAVLSPAGQRVLASHGFGR